MTTTDLDTVHRTSLPSTGALDHEAIVPSPGLDRTASDASTSAGAPRSGRLVGIDIARALALVGMFTQHVSISDSDGGFSTGWVSWVFTESAGRASVLFFILSGVSLSIIHSKGSASATNGALWRRGVVLLVGGLLVTATIWPASILQHYGVAFLAAPLLLRLNTRRLATATAAGLIGGPIFLLFARNWSGEVSGAWSGQTGSWLINTIWELLVAGLYPMVLWIGFFTLGMLIGRLDLRADRVVVRMLAVAVLSTLAIGALSAQLTEQYGDFSKGDFVGDGSGSTGGGDFNESDTFAGSADDPWNDDSLWMELPDGSFKFLGDESKLEDFDDSFGTGFPDVDRPATWQELYDVTGHSGHIGWTMQTSAVALAIMSAALLLPRAATSALSPLAWMGSMSLTAYLVHIVLVGDVFDKYIADANWSVVEKEWALLGLIGVMVVACSAFHFALRVGPFEWLLKKFTVSNPS